MAAPLGAVLIASLTAGAAMARAPSADDIRNMSIDQLADIDVSSVSKTAEPLSQAPAAVFVITHDDIARSGANSMPEILRLAPNLQVYQTNASQYVVTARGFNGNTGLQSFSNKLLVLIDGRTVYSPLFSGVYWDVQDVPVNDIERIEVISGPGATLWGSNAVNGVINILTRGSGQTQGVDLYAYGGDRTAGASLRYGGHIGDAATYRLYAMGQWDRESLTSTGAGGGDNWSKPQAGFRVDWAPGAADAVTVQGDGYSVRENPGSGLIIGGNVLGRWTRSFTNGSAVQVQAYYDRTQRGNPVDGKFTLDTVDLDIQHNFNIGPHQLVWGGGIRSNRYLIAYNGGLQFSPPGRTLNLADLFAQDSFTVAPTVKLIFGLKLESDPYIGTLPLPDVRLTWTPAKDVMLWGAASYAIRSPTPFDRDVVEKVGGVTLLTGRSNFQPERVVAYELGGRFRPISRLSLSVSAYYNVYNDLRTIEPTPKTFSPLYWGNGLSGQVWGIESWAEYQAADWWRLSGSVALLRERFSFEPGASGFLGGAVQGGDDPQHQASLKSSMNLGSAVTLDADLRYVDALPNPATPAYTELNGRLAWNITDKLELSVVGRNLLRAYHQEYPGADAVPRQVYAALRARF